jgi:hypothetical protein
MNCEVEFLPVGKASKASVFRGGFPVRANYSAVQAMPFAAEVEDYD